MRVNSSAVGFSSIALVLALLPVVTALPGWLQPGRRAAADAKIGARYTVYDSPPEEPYTYGGSGPLPTYGYAPPPPAPPPVKTTVSVAESSKVTQGKSAVSLLFPDTDIEQARFPIFLAPACCIRRALGAV